MDSQLTGKKKEVVQYIEQKIQQEGLSAGDKLDTESNIAKALGITRMTVREATRYLVELGIVYRIKGSGLYVGTMKKTGRGSFHVLSPFDYQAKKAGKIGIRQVISVAIIEVPNVQIAHALKIKPKDRVYYIERLMSFGTMPVALEQIHIPTNISESFQFNRIEESKYAYLESLTGKKVHTREQDISAFNLNDPEIVNLLKVDVGQAMIELREVVYFDDGTPFEYTIATINTDLFNIHQITSRN
ncbi:GntR family transcriptional regulator [Mergibacter septicus]|uniref:GntR family transcriptional regulator n=1 Tax=Mergibacter septicus TaxID=221402 RepID=UPI0011796C56|nr:GntR family transcriptional regulator [Mergibacter septicus]AWX13966.1 GntR family transcriptional regulator [Mergibacter septicus]QDJ13437.1 GntR family transcriptional regulator [Mergibacter septicus]